MAAGPESSEADKLATTYPGIWQEAADRLRLAIDAESQDRDNAIEDLEFADGRQWPDDLYNFRKINKRPSLTINHTDMLVKRVINNMRAQRPRIKVHPVASAEVQDAKVISGLIRHIETWSNASVAYDTGGEFAVRIGWGWWRIVSEYVDEKAFEQELKILPIRNVFTVYADPSASMPDASDMDWCIISNKLKRIEYKRLYPDADMDEYQSFGPGDSMEADWETKEDIRLAEYFRVRQTKETLYRLTSGSGIWLDDWQRWQDRIKKAGFDLARDEKGEPITRPSARRNIEWYRINGTKVIDKRIIPGHWIPVVRCEGNALDYNGKVRRKGMVRDMKDPARMFNYWRTATTEKIALAPKAPFVGYEGQTDGHSEWDDANQKPYSILLVKPITGPDGVTVLPLPTRQPAVAVEAGLVQAAQDSEHDLLAVAGMPHDPQQDAPGSVVSGKALRQRQMLSDVSHFQYYDNQTMAIAHTGRILLDQIPYYYSESRMQRIIGEDGMPSMVAINQSSQKMDPETGEAIDEIKNDLTVGRYDVVMDTGPGYETKRQEAAEAMIDLMRTELGKVVVQTAPDIALRNMDFPGADELANRAMPLTPPGLKKAMENLSDEGKAIVQSLGQQLSHLQQQNQDLQKQVKYKTDIEHGWMSVELEKARVADQRKGEDIHVRATTAHNTAELSSATDIIVENLKHKHDVKMADKDASHELGMAGVQQAHESRMAKEAPKGNSNG